MSSTTVVTPQHRDEILANQIDRHEHIILTHRLPQGWRTYKSRFVTGDAVSKTFGIDPLQPRGEGGGPLPKTGSTVGVTFRLGHKKCMFSTVLLKSEPTTPRLRWPDHLQQLQRRAYERAVPPSGRVIAVRFRPVDDRGETSPHVGYGELENISAGGMRLNVPVRETLQMGAGYHCTFTPRPGDEPIALEATLRHREAAGGERTSVGFQFLGLEAAEDGRRVLDRLARIVSYYQRARRRMG